MDLGQLLKMGAEVFMQSNLSGNAGSGLNSGALSSALGQLLGGQGGSGGLDLGGLLSGMNSGGMSNVAQSWLGSGANEAISPNQLTDVLGADRIAEFASQLGLSEQEAAGGLSDALPQIVDKASPGGSLLDSLGGVSGALEMAGKIFGR